MLAGKNIVLGVSGGIAAYKVVEVASRLKKAGAFVHVIMTDSATKFVTPLTFREISGNPVVVDMWEEPKQYNVQHIALATLADLFLIAPATANIIGKIANGIADDFLSTTVMATKAPVFLAPAMNTNMFQNIIVQSNLKKLEGVGCKVIQPGEGLLACGVEGPGRLPEPEELVREVEKFFNQASKLAGKKVLVTAGGTREAIDPVRFISNHSSGKMGYAIAEAAAEQGAEVVLVSGPTNLKPPAGVKFIPVESADQMRQAVIDEFACCDIVVKAAAVADFRPSQVSQHKIKKTGDTLTLVLEKNPDILAELGRLKTTQVLVGFAAESQELVNNAAEKLNRKNLDMIVANDITMPGAGFNADTNIVKLLYRDGRREELSQMPKRQLAAVILDRILQNFLIKN